jgi:hypothetical protein
MMLTTFKKNITVPPTYAEDGKSFLNDIHEHDNKRLDKIKNNLYAQASEQHYQSSVPIH